jgi:hypothetical protein
MYESLRLFSPDIKMYPYEDLTAENAEILTNGSTWECNNSEQNVLLLDDIQTNNLTTPSFEQSVCNLCRIMFQVLFNYPSPPAPTPN